MAILAVESPPTLFVNATGILAHSASGGIAVDTVSSESDGSIGSVSLSLNVQPPPGALAPVPSHAMLVGL